MIQETFRWWLVVSVIGLIALPIAMTLFRDLPGRGIAFAKPLGLLLTGYLFWLALSLHVMPNRPGTIVWALIALIAVDYLILRRRWPEYVAALRERAGLAVAVEVVFFAGLFVAAHIKSFIPEISGTEKPMDFMFLNAASRSTYYPPDDPWFAGAGVSYYYFGYVINAMVAKLAALNTAVAFNIGLAGTAALAATAAFGLGYEVVSALRRVAFRTAVGVGVAAIVLVTVAGNLEGVLEFGAANGVLPDAAESAADVSGLGEAPESDACLLPVVCLKYPTDESDFWWWWRATRISPDAGTITEFPFFSFILGDLHPHVMALPFVLTGFALGLSLWRSDGRLSEESWRLRPSMLLLSGVVVGGLAFLNTWDLVTFGFLIALLVLARNLVARSDVKQAFRDAAGFMLPLAAISVLLYLPFYLSFSSQAGFIDAVRDGATRPMQAFLFWGAIMAVALPLPLYLIARDAAARSPGRLRLAVAVPAVLLAAWLLLLAARHGAAGVPDAFEARGWNWLTALFFGAGLVACALALWHAIERREEDSGVLVPALAAMTTALLLIFGGEFFYVTDVFGSRLNTVFKFYYQAWLLLGVAGAVGAWWLYEELKSRAPPSFQVWRGAWAGIAALLVVGALLYPLGVTLSRTGGLTGADRTLDGLAYVGSAPSSAELGLVLWLRRNADRDDRLIEGVGGQYSAAGRLSAWTGVPTLLGWGGHEHQWGRNGAEIARREAAVATVYTTASLEEALAILQQYGVTYVAVGDVERAMYPRESLQKFESLQPVVSAGTAVLYRVPPVADVAEGDSAGVAP
jgi:YYY domain-containing protein